MYRCHLFGIVEFCKYFIIIICGHNTYSKFASPTLETQVSDCNSAFGSMDTFSYMSTFYSLIRFTLRTMESLISTALISGQIDEKEDVMAPWCQRNASSKTFYSINIHCYNINQYNRAICWWQGKLCT
jgi:hypothetical protein